MKKHTKKNPINRKDKLNIILAKSSYIQLVNKNKSNLECKCVICGHSFKAIGYMKRKKLVCPICKNNRMASLKYDKRQKQNKRNKNIDNNLTSIKKICGYTSYCNAMKNKLCPYCVINDKVYYSKKEFMDIIKNVNPSIEIVGDYIDLLTPIEYKCKKCGSINYGKPYDLLEGASKCKKGCIKNVREQIILYLLEHDISYTQNKIVNDYSLQFPIMFDFYLSDYNVVIEYDNIFHYNTIVSNESQLMLSKNQSNNSIIEDYCNEKHILLIRINNDGYSIKEVLDKYLLPFIDRG